jgi:hypothetical protein
MTRQFLPYQSPAQQPPTPQQPTAPWWRPLTRWWGICGVIIFAGLVMSLVDGASQWSAEQPAAAIKQQLTDGR